jgi:hypothetical protein
MMFLVAAMSIFLAKLGIKPHRRVGSFYQQDAEQARICIHLCRWISNCRWSRISASGTQMRAIGLPPAALEYGSHPAPLLGLLLAHVAGPDLRRIPDPNLMSQPLQQADKPLAVAD